MADEDQTTEEDQNKDSEDFQAGSIDTTGDTTPPDTTEGQTDETGESDEEV